MVGDFTCTSGDVGLPATNTVVAGPGSLIAVPFWTSSVSVGCCGGTTWLWAKGRPGARRDRMTDGRQRRPCAGGRTDRLDRHRSSRRRRTAPAPGAAAAAAGPSARTSSTEHHRHGLRLWTCRLCRAKWRRGADRGGVSEALHDRRTSRHHCRRSVGGKPFALAVSELPSAGVADVRRRDRRGGLGDGGRCGAVERGRGCYRRSRCPCATLARARPRGG